MTRPSRNRPGSSELLNGDDIWRKCDRGKSDDAYTWLELGRHPGLRLRCGGHHPQLDRSGAESACGCPNYTLKPGVCPPVSVRFRGAVAEPFLHYRDAQVASFGRRSLSAAASARSISSIGALSSPAGSCETNARFQQNLSLQHRPWTSEAGRQLPEARGTLPPIELSLITSAFVATRHCGAI